MQDKTSCLPGSQKSLRRQKDKKKEEQNLNRLFVFPKVKSMTELKMDPCFCLLG